VKNEKEEEGNDKKEVGFLALIHRSFSNAFFIVMVMLMT